MPNFLEDGYEYWNASIFLSVSHPTFPCFIKCSKLLSVYSFLGTLISQFYYILYTVLLYTLYTIYSVCIYIYIYITIFASFQMLFMHTFICFTLAPDQCLFKVHNKCKCTLLKLWWRKINQYFTKITLFFIWKFLQSLWPHLCCHSQSEQQAPMCLFFFFSKISYYRDNIIII